MRLRLRTSQNIYHEGKSLRISHLCTRYGQPENRSDMGFILGHQTAFDGVMPRIMRPRRDFIDEQCTYQMRSALVIMEDVDLPF